jgi:hypothetical protein
MGEGQEKGLEARFGFDGAWYQVEGAEIVKEGPEGKPVLGVRYV